MDLGAQGRNCLAGFLDCSIRGENPDALQDNTPGEAFHGPFSEDFTRVHLEGWLHGPIRLTDAQARVFAALWERRDRAQSSEFTMHAAGLDSEKPMDVFKVKAANRGDPVYQGPLHARNARVFGSVAKGLRSSTVRGHFRASPEFRPYINQAPA